MISKASLTVTQLNTYIKMLLEGDMRLRNVCVLGEISNFTEHYRSGHLYFSLKDDSASVKAVMFASSARLLKFKPENGMSVYVRGRVSVYERDGAYQIYVQSMEPEGAGALMLYLEQLKQKLASEGLFDEGRKRSLPKFPKKIAVITSSVGAAVRDVINVISRRYPLTELVIIPAAVQGADCAADNINALALANEIEGAELIILCRGGGSAEDLWGYNSEQLVRAVAASRLPVITGVGHETDFTLCDFAADLRAPTPSAAAELAVPDISELMQYCDSLSRRAYDCVCASVEREEQLIENTGYRLKALSPVLTVERQLDYLGALALRAENALDRRFTSTENTLSEISSRLLHNDPYALIAKGYVPVTLGGARVTSADMLKIGDEPHLSFEKVQVVCKVTEINKIQG